MEFKKQIHWNDLYGKKEPTEVTWYQSVPKLSLKLIQSLNLNADDSIIDIGCGASTLVDYLIEEGQRNITLVDLSENALGYIQNRLGESSKYTKMIAGDVLEVPLPGKYKLWHDRAVFHFLTAKSEQDSYLEILNQSLEVGSFVVISTFAEDGPLKCSGLEIVRYSKEDLLKKFGESFELLQFEKETHVSPGGMEQKFNYWVLKKIQ